MFKYEELRAAHLEITSNCQASCPMCARNINGKTNPNLKITSWTFEDYRRIFLEDVLKQMQHIRFSGNYGDPIINDELLDMIEYTSFVNPKINIRIHTNGSARNIIWWEKLARFMTKTSDVYFALDGLEDTHHLHRVGTNFETIIRNAKAYMAAGGNAVWVWNTFKHNEHQVEEGERRAIEMGFTRFLARNSIRFFNSKKFQCVDNNDNITHYIEPPTNASDVSYMDNKYSTDYEERLHKAKIDCAVLRNKEIYIDAWQRVYPCVFLGVNNKFAAERLTSVEGKSKDFHNMIKDIEKEKREYFDRIEKNGGNDLNTKSLYQVLNGYEWSSIDWHKEYWNGCSNFKFCASKCGEFTDISRPNDQYYKVDTLRYVSEEYDNNRIGVEETRRGTKSANDYRREMK